MREMYIISGIIFYNSVYDSTYNCLSEKFPTYSYICDYFLTVYFVLQRLQLLKLEVPYMFMQLALDEGPGPPIKYQYAELGKLYAVVSQLVRCCDVSNRCQSSSQVCALTRKIPKTILLLKLPTAKDLSMRHNIIPKETSIFYMLQKLIYVCTQKCLHKTLNNTFLLSCVHHKKLKMLHLVHRFWYYSASDKNVKWHSNLPLNFELLCHVVHSDLLV